MAAKKG